LIALQIGIKKLEVHYITMKISETL